MAVVIMTSLGLIAASAARADENENKAHRDGQTWFGLVV